MIALDPGLGVAALVLLPLLGAPVAAQTAEGIVTVGPLTGASGSNTDCTHCTDTHAGFQAAVATLGGQGGEIVVLAGRYELAETVVLPPGTTLRGSRGAVLRAAPGFPGPLLRAPSGRVALVGLTIEELAPEPLRTGLVELTGSHLVVRDCAFELGHASSGNGTAPLVAVNLGPATGEATYFTDALVEANHFVLHPSPDPASWTRHVGLQARNGRNVRVIANTFAGAVVGEVQTQGDLHLGVHLFNVEVEALAANVFRALFSEGHVDATVTGCDELDCPAWSAAVSIRNFHDEDLGTGKEGHHSSIVANSFERVLSPFAVDAWGTGFHAITGNTFVEGRGAVRVQGKDSLVHANVFDAMGPRQGSFSVPWIERTVELHGGMNHMISGNLFDRCVADQLLIGPESTYVQVHANQLRSATSPGFAGPAIGIAATADKILVHGNSLLGTWAGPLHATPAGVTIDAADNWTN